MQCCHHIAATLTSLWLTSGWKTPWRLDIKFLGVPGHWPSDSFYRIFPRRFAEQRNTSSSLVALLHCLLDCKPLCCLSFNSSFSLLFSRYFFVELCRFCVTLCAVRRYPAFSCLLKSETSRCEYLASLAFFLTRLSPPPRSTSCHRDDVG